MGDIVMAPHTLSPNRDLNQSELNTLEALVDATSIEAVIQGLSEICGAKAEHVAQNSQDTILAKRWATMWRSHRPQSPGPCYKLARCWRCAARNSAGSPSAQHARFAQRPRCSRQGWRGISLSRGCLGRHNHPAWALNAHCARRTSRIRKGAK
jgi:hypothetical protein